MAVTMAQRIARAAPRRARQLHSMASNLLSSTWYGEAVADRQFPASRTRSAGSMRAMSGLIPTRTLSVRQFDRRQIAAPSRNAQVSRLGQVELRPRNAIAFRCERDVSEERQVGDESAHTFEERRRTDVVLGHDGLAVDHLDMKLLQPSDHAPSMSRTWRPSRCSTCAS